MELTTIMMKGIAGAVPHAVAKLAIINAAIPVINGMVFATAAIIPAAAPRIVMAIAAAPIAVLAVIVDGHGIGVMWHSPTMQADGLKELAISQQQSAQTWSVISLELRLSSISICKIYAQV